MKWILRRTQEDKSLAINERGLTSANWTVYNDGTKRSRYNTLPTSDITAETVTADGLTVITCRTGHHALRHITWESPLRMGGRLNKRRRSFAPQGRAGNGVPASHPTQPIATRPLAIRKDGTWFAYGWDLTKNICEVFGQHGYLRTAYSYSPYGEITADGDVTQPIQWSSEYNDTETALVYYNYRHYNPLAGRWIGRDRIESDYNTYDFVNNLPLLNKDSLGNIITPSQGQRYSESFILDVSKMDNKEHNSDPKEGYKICNQYLQINSKPCIRNKCREHDSYPEEAKIACDGFIDMYTKNGKLRNSVLCVAKCLTNAELTNSKYEKCEKRNALRLLSHFDCYMQCGFIMDISKERFGVPGNGWEIGIYKLIPDFIGHFYSPIIA